MEEKKTGENKSIVAVIVLSVICLGLLAAAIVLAQPLIQSAAQYNEAVQLMEAGKYDEAIGAFEDLGSFSDASQKAEECRQARLDGTYVQAMAALEKKSYIVAYETFAELGDYKDAQVQKEQIYDDYKQALMKYAYESSTVFFGSYEQDGDRKNGKEDIEWIVVDKKGNKLMLLSKYVLDAQTYNTESENVTWETCSLRPWLNDTFYNDAFSQKEQAMILTSTATPDRNAQFGVNSGNETQDKVYLLSGKEAEEFFYSDLERLCQATPFAKNRGVSVNNSNGFCSWWLRTPGWDYYVGGCVDSFGVVSYVGDYVYHLTVGVRPVIWIDISSLVE